MGAEILEALGAIVGAIAVWLMVRENAWGWPVGLLNLVAYVVVFGRARLYGAMGLQVVYIALSLYGWYEWKHGASGQPLRVSRAPRRVLAGLLTIGVASAVALATVLARFTDEAVPWIDAPLTAASLVAQALQTRKWIENWVVWMVVNTAYVGLFAARGMWPTAALYLAFLLLAILGLREWRRSMAAAPAPFRPLRVVLTGSECTGKTTLASLLSRTFGASGSVEFSRGYAERRGGLLSAEDVEPIARGQIAVEDEATAAGRRLVVHDTDLVSTLVYARHYYGQCPAWIAETAERRLADLYLLCHTDVPWKDDGVRDQPLARETIHAAFVETLRALGAKVVDLEGSLAERQTMAEAAVTALLPAG